VPPPGVLHKHVSAAQLKIIVAIRCRRLGRCPGDCPAGRCLL